MDPKPSKETVADLLEEIGVLLEMKGENPFKCRAYAHAARTVRALEGDLREAVESGSLRRVKGIGDALFEKITEIVKTGRSAYYEEIKASLPEGLMHLLSVPGLGPKKVMKIYEALGIATVGELEYACHENRLVGLEGFGARSQEKILEGIAYLKKSQGQFHVDFALREGSALLEQVRRFKGVARAELAGSLRRYKETVKDIDFVAASDRPGPLMDFFASLPEVEAVIAKGETKTSIRLASGINADLRVVSPGEFPFALLYLTGSKEHNTTMRGIAKRAGYKLNEYGLFKGEVSPVPCRSEEEVFEKLGMAYIPPELREDQGEIEAARTGALPSLVEGSDLRGLLHAHTHWSDGGASLEAMARQAQSLGYVYLGISEHSQSARYAHGLTVEKVREQQEEIDRLNRQYQGFKLLKGIEADILSDGSLDYPDEVLETFDFVIASVHSRFQIPREEMTLRVIRALQNPRVAILGHPTGRLLLSRDGYSIDMESVIEAAAARGAAIELNAHPYRLDLDWRLCRRAKERGVKIAINPDAHSLDGLQDTIYGVGIARKGWLEKDDVLNAMALEDLKEWIAKKKSRALHAAR
jgi:DNA polymerase (family 10)